MTGPAEGTPGFLEIAANLEAARLLPFKMLAALTKLGKLTPQEALQVADEMLAAVPDDLREHSRQHFQNAIDKG